MYTRLTREGRVVRSGFVTLIRGMVMIVLVTAAVAMAGRTIVPAIVRSWQTPAPPPPAMAVNPSPAVSTPHTVPQPVYSPHAALQPVYSPPLPPQAAPYDPPRPAPSYSPPMSQGTARYRAFEWHWPQKKSKDKDDKRAEPTKCNDNTKTGKSETHHETHLPQPTPTRGSKGSNPGPHQAPPPKKTAPAPVAKHKK